MGQRGDRKKRVILPRVHTDTCARCGCDRKEQRRGQFRCKANGVLYSSHKWGWEKENK